MKRTQLDSTRETRPVKVNSRAQEEDDDSVNNQEQRNALWSEDEERRG
jgi:hypothetical protein